MELFKPDFGLVFWMFVAFGVLFFCLWKWAWPVIIKGIEERADLIDKGVEYARSAKEQLDNARAEADRQIAEARREQAEILREADKMKTRIIEEAREAARTEARKVMDAAKVSIDQERKQAEESLRKEMSSMALAVADKVVRSRLSDDTAQRKLVDQLIDEMDRTN